MSPTGRHEPIDVTLVLNEEEKEPWWVCDPLPSTTRRHDGCKNRRVSALSTHRASTPLSDSTRGGRGDSQPPIDQCQPRCDLHLLKLLCRE